MVTMFNPKPQLMRSVAKPVSVSTKELAEARPVYIDGLPDVTGLQAILEDFEDRIAGLESTD